MTCAPLRSAGFDLRTEFEGIYPDAVLAWISTHRN
jgi:hypothetical protein